MTMAVRISRGLVLLFGVQALVQPPARPEQVHVLGCFGGMKPNSARCQDGKCLGWCGGTFTSVTLILVSAAAGSVVTAVNKSYLA